jgi:hypothetical protein
MEQNQNPSSIVLDLDLRKLHDAFITNIQGQREKRRCICIPIIDNFIAESGYTTRDNHEVRTAIVRIRLWPVSQESKEQYGKKQDWDAKLEITKEARETLPTINPTLAAQLNRDDPAYDKEIVKQALPYVGAAYSQYPRTLPQEQVSTISVEAALGEKEDLPF